MSRPQPWLVSLPLMAVGCLGAHSVAYRLVGPAEATSHDYFALAPLVLGICAALGIVAAFRASLAGRIERAGSAYAFGLLPPLAFTLQEHLERVLHDGAVPLETALDPAFLLGLALQLPFAVGAFVVTRGLLRIAEAAGTLLRRTAPAHLRPSVVLRPASPHRGPRVPPLASSQAGRAPPLPA